MLLRDLVLIVLVTLGAVAASQVPQIIQEYEQRLGGARDEANRLLAGHAETARTAGMTLNQYVAFLRSQNDSRIAVGADTIAAHQQRARFLTDHARALAAAAPWLKPWVMARGHDRPLLTATWHKYRLVLILDQLFAGLGLALGWLVHALIWALLAALFAPRGRAL
ncbi:MAG: DUF2937 family protein [Pseudomonadota bacterium]|nr:DUF2937 family protein [Pseudomonadota bacterium]